MKPHELISRLHRQAVAAGQVQDANELLELVGLLIATELVLTRSSARLVGTPMTKLRDGLDSMAAQLRGDA